MSIKDSRLLKVVAAGAAGVMILGLAAVVTSAQRGLRDGPPMVGQGGPGGAMGRGMMGGPGMRGGRGRPGGPLGMLGPGMRALELTDEQRQQIREAIQSHQPEFEAIGKEMGAARRALQEAITADEIDLVAIGNRVDAVAAVEKKAAILRATAHAEVVALLTPEQQQKAKELKAQAEKRMKERTEQMRERRDQMRQRRQQIQDTTPIGDPGLV